MAIVLVSKIWVLVRHVIERKKKTYGCFFQSRVRSGHKAKNRNVRTAVPSTTAAEDMDYDEFSQPVSGLFGPRDPDYCQPASGRLEWALGRQLRCGGWRNWRTGSWHFFPCHRLSPLEHFIWTVRRQRHAFGSSGNGLRCSQGAKDFSMTRSSP